MRINPAYVVGYGMVDALGNNPSDCFMNLINDYNPIQKLDFMGDHKIQYAIPCLHELSLPEAFTPKITANMTRAQQMALHATEQALKMANLPHSSNVAVIVSSVSNDVEFLDGNFQRFKENKRVNPFKIVNRIPDMIVGQITSHYKFHGASLAIYASCATGMYSIDYAMRILDEYDYVIVGGADAGVFEIALKYFAGIGALGNHNSPFDEDREGFVMGEGAGILILQSKDKVKEYNSKVHAKLYPVGAASDAVDLTSPATDGRGARIALDKALNSIESDMIDIVSAHATSTPMGDEVEYNILKEELPDIPIYAPKSKIGHTLAAASVLECIYSILSMKNRVIPGCYNLKNAEYDVSKQLVRSSCSLKTTHKHIRTLNNSFGFGGKCASQVVEVKL
jgi:3-oxoacyl-[acyl-carrier-protein] synthase II